MREEAWKWWEPEKVSVNPAGDKTRVTPASSSLSRCVSVYLGT